MVCGMRSCIQISSLNRDPITSSCVSIKIAGKSAISNLIFMNIQKIRLQFSVFLIIRILLKICQTYHLQWSQPREALLMHAVPASMSQRWQSFKDVGLNSTSLLPPLCKITIHYQTTPSLHKINEERQLDSQSSFC